MTPPLALDAVRRAVGDVLALVLPVQCAGCDAADINLCEQCRDRLAPVVTVRTIAGIDVWSGLRFDDEVARVVRALKADGRTSLARPLGAALAAAAGAAVRGAPDTPPAFVPVPASRTSFRRRGFRPVELLARRAGLPLRPALRLVRATADQRELDAAARAANVADAFAARDVDGLEVLVVDDVVTTGATLSEAARALREAGARVRGAVTVAATPRRRASVVGDVDASGIGA